jgi:hypothetical protein
MLRIHYFRVKQTPFVRSMTLTNGQIRLKAVLLPLKMHCRCPLSFRLERGQRMFQNVFTYTRRSDMSVHTPFSSLRGWQGEIWTSRMAGNLIVCFQASHFFD